MQHLFQVFAEAALSADSDDWTVLPLRFREELHRLAAKYGKQAIPKEDSLRVVADAIAGMTDHQAVLLHQRFMGVLPGSAFDSIV